MCNMSDETDKTGGASEGSLCSSVPKKRTYPFQDDWLQNPSYAAWLEKSEDLYQAKCKICNKSFTARKSTLDQHMKTSMHMLGMQCITDNEGPFFDFEKALKRAEIKYTLDIVDHNRSFHSYEHCVKMFIDTFPHFKSMQRLKLKRKKITAIIKNVLSKNIVLETTKLLQHKFFSILVGESTDSSNVKNLCILVRYVDGVEIKTYLLDLLRVNAGTAEYLFNCLKHCLHKNNLSMNNFVGFCAVNTSIMFGKSNSVVSRLLATNKEIFVFECICHSLHLVAKHAYESLPKKIDNFLQDVYCYFSRSSKRQEALEIKQKNMNAQEQKMLTPNPTRLLGLFQCIERIINQWPILYEVFKDASDKRESRQAKLIFDMFQCKFTKACLQFLLLPLELFVQFNAIFEQSTFTLHTMLPLCKILLKHLAQFFIKTDCLTMTENTHQINIDEQHNMLPLDKIYIGENARETIEQIKNENTEKNNIRIIIFYKDVQKFYKIAFKELVSRIPYNETFLDALDCLKPENALEILHSSQPIFNITNRFSSKLNREEVAKEWRLLPMQFSPAEKQLLKTMDITDFWQRVSEIKDPAQDKYMYENLVRLAQLCLTLPHSNTDVERLFSLVTNIKTKYRNRLKSQTVAALARIKLELKNRKQNCITYPVTDAMYELFNTSMYDTEQIPENLQGILLSDKDDSDSEQSEDERNLHF